MNTNVITLTDTNWTYISDTLTRDADGFIFWVDADALFSEKSNPAVDEQIPISINTKYKFKKPTGFYISGSIGTNIFLSPFDK